MKQPKQNLLENLATKLFESPVINGFANYLCGASKFLSCKLGLRSRYFFNKQNGLRLRYITGLSTFMIAAIASFTFTAQKTDIFSTYQVASIAPAAGHPANIIDGELLDVDDSFKTAAVLTEVLKPLSLDREVEVQSGDVFSKIMERNGVGNSDATAIFKKMEKHFNPRHIKVGQKIAMHFDPAAEEENGQRFREMEMKLDPLRTLIVARAGDDFDVKVKEKPVEKVVKAKQATIQGSIHRSAAKAGIPKRVIANAMKIYSSSVDFQRDVKANHSIEVMYESFETETGYVAKTGNILYANLKMGKREIPLYRYKMRDGRTDYFQPSGRSIKHTLMKTPIKGARMSSGFGKRRHPVLGYTKMHAGVDFAAPKGTPIFAAGDGVVEKAGWFSSYGKYIRIRHGSKLKTAYAHMSKINSKVKAGQRVKQGQVIGYVGTTGRSTGPHLHYEVMKNGHKVNPRSVNLPVGEDLYGKEKENFKYVMNKLRRQYAATVEGIKVASNNR